MNPAIKKTLKFLLYLIVKIGAAAIALYLVYFSFMAAMNTMNINVMVKDAFTKRASVILDPIDNKDTDLLDNVFTGRYLEETGLDTQTENRFYDVSLYMQRTDVKLKLVTPKQKEAVIEVTDIVDDIRAELVNADDPAFAEKASLMDSGKYEVKVIKTEDGWLIDDIEMIEEITPEYVRPLPTKTAEPVMEASEEEGIEVIDEDDETV